MPDGVGPRRMQLRYRESKYGAYVFTADFGSNQSNWVDPEAVVYVALTNTTARHGVPLYYNVSAAVGVVHGDAVRCRFTR